MPEWVQDESGLYLPKLASDGLPARGVGPWAKEKLAVLSRYLDLFTVGMKPSAKKRHNWSGLGYIDLFAGPGKCIVRETGEELDGSALVALRTRHPFSQIHLVESDAKVFGILQQRVGADQACHCLHMNCNEATKAIVQKRKPNFLYVAFVDPTGLDIHFDTIRSLAGDLRCDLIINWFMSALTRNMSVWQQGQESERLDRFFGTHEWVQCVPPTVTPKVAFQCLVKLYRQQLERIGYGYQAQPQIIKNRQNAEMYWLWFASRSGTGKDFWLKAVKSAREQREFDFDDRT